MPASSSMRNASPSTWPSGSGTRVTTRPGASGTPRWSCDPCQNRRTHPSTRATRASWCGKSGRQMSEP